MIIISSKSSSQFISRYEGNYHKDIILGIGGGQVAEEAKWVGKHLRKEVILVPTNLSCDAFWTKTVAVRIPGKQPVYVDAVRPITVEFDGEILTICHKRYLVAGWADILSGITAMDRMAGNQYTIQMCKLIDKCCYPGTVEEIKVLFDTLEEEVKLCDLAGSSAVEEGLEHKIAYELEKYNKFDLLHGELVFMGIQLLMQKGFLMSSSCDKIKYFFNKLEIKPTEWVKLFGKDLCEAIVDEVWR